jgi:hypothetical protein
MNPLTSFLSLALLFTGHAARAALPQVDFERMGRVGLAGAFAGLDIFSASSVSFDPTTSTLLSREKDGSLTRIASTNPGGSILAGCSVGTTYYVAGSFSTINGVSASNIAAYNPSSRSFSQVGSSGPDGQLIHCTAMPLITESGLAASSLRLAVRSPFSMSRRALGPVPLFAASREPSHSLNLLAPVSQAASLFFTGSFVASFGNGTALNGTNNPNVPFSSGASPFSSSLVPIPLQNVQIDGSPSSSQTGFSDIRNTLCPSGADGPGNTWFAADGSTPLSRSERSLSSLLMECVLGTHSNLIMERLVSRALIERFYLKLILTYFSGSVTTIPDNNVRTLKYLDPTTGRNVTCETCPLSTDSSDPLSGFPVRPTFGYYRCSN